MQTYYNVYSIIPSIYVTNFRYNCVVFNESYLIFALQEVNNFEVICIKEIIFEFQASVVFSQPFFQDVCKIE